MLLQLSEQIRECYRHAKEARRTADATTNPNTKADFLDVEQRWLSLAHSYEFAERLSGFMKPYAS
jgi:hypothetical protein